VTRHVPEELGNDDWNTMVLHYLGLDHIGHKAGPRRSYDRQQVTSNELTSLQLKYDSQAARNGWHCPASLYCDRES
jgi:hypothetical protein